MTEKHRYAAWVANAALPLWAEAGFDPLRDRFHERLDPAAQPLDVPHRTMVQARQIYVFAHAALLGWHDRAGDMAERAMASLLRDHCETADGRSSFCFSIDAHGAPVSTVWDAYTHAFVLFAAAWLHRLNGDPALLAMADRVLAHIDATLLDPVHGGLFDAHPVTATTKRQNPLMHLLEALLFLHRTAPEGRYLERAETLVELFKARLFRARPGILIEHFAQDWSYHPDAARADVFEPGHHFEWAWLLAEYGQLSGKDLRPWSDRLRETALAHGRSPSGLIVDEVDADFAIVNGSTRLWPHTEALKAGVALHREGNPRGLALAGDMAGKLCDTFLDRPFAGGWVDHFDAAGRPLVDYVPASSFYHLFLAASEIAGIPDEGSS